MGICTIFVVKTKRKTDANGIGCFSSSSEKRRNYSCFLNWVEQTQKNKNPWKGEFQIGTPPMADFGGVRMLRDRSRRSESGTDDFRILETMVMGFEVTIFAQPSRKLRRERPIEGIERHPFARAFQSDEPSSAKFPQPSLEVRSEPVITRPRHSKAKFAHPQPDSFLLGLLIRGHFHPFVEPEFAERYRCLRASQQVRPPLESSALTTQCLVAPNR